MRDALRKSPVTMILLAMTTLVFLAMQVLYLGNASTGTAVFNFGGMYGAYVAYDPSQLWRLVTPIFVHIGWQHFIFNALTLYFVGQLAEQIWGHHKFLVVEGLTESLLVLDSHPDGHDWPQIPSEA